jgi:inosine/xanthosine triphosphatase
VAEAPPAARTATAGALARVRRVAVGSTNPVKVAAARAVLARVAPHAAVSGVATPSGVAEQPWGDDETIRGALARAAGAREALDADLGVGFEGGVVEGGDGLRSCAWAAVTHREGTSGVGGSLAMPLPPAVAALVRAGTELGAAMDLVASARGTKHDPGAVGILTAGLIDRQRAYEVILTYALAPLLAPEYWAAGGGSARAADPR